jgi:hypothetical protein
VLKLHEQFAIIIDWKTGKVLEDPVQLLLSAATVFYHHPEVQVCRSVYAWLAENAESDEIIHRKELPEMWNNLWERVEELQHAHATTSYPPKPSYLCRRYCPVVACPYHGKGG